jgi:hypothetical protein
VAQEAPPGGSALSGFNQIKKALLLIKLSRVLSLFAREMSSGTNNDAIRPRQNAITADKANLLTEITFEMKIYIAPTSRIECLQNLSLQKKLLLGVILNTAHLVQISKARLNW